MDGKRVILVKTNPIDHDTRLPKEIEALQRGGSSITLLCWDTSCRSPRHESRSPAGQPFTEIRVRLKAPRGIRVLPFLPIWWVAVLFRLILEKWDIVHAINLDSVVPAAVASRLKRKPLIYEVLETYGDQMVLPRAVRSISIKAERMFMRLATSVILVDEGQIDEFGGIPNSKMVTVYDSPPDVLGRVDSTHQRSDRFTLLYDGMFNRARRMNLDKVITALRGIDDVRLLITGHGDQVAEIKEWAAQMPDKVRFLGLVSYEEVLRRSAEADLLFALPDPKVPLNRYVGGSKFLKAMMCGRPIIANEGTPGARRVREYNCGLVVDANNPEEIRAAIVRLKENPGLCKELGANGRKAYEQRYSWPIMAQRLIGLYEDLTEH